MKLITKSIAHWLCRLCGVVCGVLSSALICLSVQAEIPRGTTIRICNDIGEWPPFYYNERVNGEKTDRVVGYDVDVLEKILAPHGINFEFDLIPWSRCLVELERGEYHLINSASYKKERDEKFLITEYYYTIEPYYFYHHGNYPDGLAIEYLADFADYKMCGLLGYNYTNFGIDADAVDASTKSFPQVIEKTLRERCDIFLARYETFVGFAKIGKHFMKDNNLGAAPMPGVEGDKFYMYVSPQYEHAQELRALLTAGIAELKLSGLAERMLAPYLSSE